MVAGYQLSNENYKVVVEISKKRFGNKQFVIDAYYHNLSHLPPATNQVSSLHQCYATTERNLRSSEAIEEDVYHRHFIALISEKLPQKVLRISTLYVTVCAKTVPIGTTIEIHFMA